MITMWRGVIKMGDGAGAVTEQGTGHGIGSGTGNGNGKGIGNRRWKWNWNKEQEIGINHFLHEETKTQIGFRSLIARRNEHSHGFEKTV
jgi:hypothetical protein